VPITALKHCQKQAPSGEWQRLAKNNQRLIVPSLQVQPEALTHGQANRAVDARLQTVHP
jgi:hypothetical protein